MSTTDYVEQFNATLADLTKPLVDQYKNLDREIAEREKDLVAMRKARTQLRGMLRGINPELVPTNGTGKKKPKHSKAQGNNAESIQALATWLQERKEEINSSDGIYASGIVNQKGEITRDDWDLPFRNQSKLSYALRVLHEQGIIRLDHIGNGGAKFYKVV